MFDYHIVMPNIFSTKGKGGWEGGGVNIIFKGAQSRLSGLKRLAKLFKFVVCNP